MKQFNLQLISCLFFLLGLFGCNQHLAQFSIENETIKIPERLALFNASKKSDRVIWDFGDGKQSSEFNPKHLYVKSGIYDVTLTSFKGSKKHTARKQITVKAPEACYVLIQTPYGNMVAKIYDETPEHRDNFIALIEKSYYDDLLFHRVIQGFMIQGGDPDSRNAPSGKMLGGGGPDYTIPAEIKSKYVHTKGALAAARTSDQVNPEKRSSGSQFYIVHGSLQSESGLIKSEDQKGIKYTLQQKEKYLNLGGAPQLDMEYTVFGELVDGFDVLDKIASAKTEASDRPTENIWMKIKAIH